MKGRSVRRWLGILATFATLGAFAVSVPLTAAAGTGPNFTVNPWVYGCGMTHNGGGTATDTPGSNGCPSGDTSGTATSTFTSGSLVLAKTGSTTNDLAAGATIGNTGAGITLTQFDFDIAGSCSAGSPRWNIETADGKTHFYGCSANNTAGHVTINAATLQNGDGSTNGGISGTDRVTALDLVADETGSSTLTNIVVTGTLLAPLTNGPNASSWAKGRLDVFIRGSDNALWHKFYSSATGWSGWSSLGAPSGVTLASDPVAVSWGVNRIDVFVRGSDNALWHKFYDINAGGWSAWNNHGGILSSGPAATSWGVGRLDVFYRLTDNTLGHIFYTSSVGAWSNQFSHGGLLAYDPGAVSWGVGRIDVFGRSTTDTLIHNDYDQTAGGWMSAWGTISGDTITSGPSATTWGVGRLDVFARGTDNALHHTYYANGGWQGWSTQANPTGDSLTSDPGGVAWASGRIDVFARGTTNNLLHKYYDVTAGGWSAWFSESLAPTPG